MSLTSLLMPIIAAASDPTWMERIEYWLAGKIASGGYPMLFGVLLSCGLGLPLPEDIPLIFAGIFVQQGKFNLAIACACAWCGIIGGDCILYSLGRRFGHDVTLIPVIGRHINTKRIAAVEIWFKKYGVWVVAIGRMFAGVRGAVVVVAGATRYSFTKFLVADGLAAIVSGGLFVLIGYKFAQNYGVIRERVHEGTTIAVIVLLTGLLVTAVLRRINRKKLELAPSPPESPPI